MNIDFRSPNPRPSKTAKTGAASVRMVSARQRRYARFFIIDGLTPTGADFQANRAPDLIRIQRGKGGLACLCPKRQVQSPSHRFFTHKNVTSWTADTSPVEMP